MLLWPLFNNYTPTRDNHFLHKNEYTTDDHADSYAVIGGQEASEPFDNGFNNLEEVEACKFLDALLLSQNSVK